MRGAQPDAECPRCHHKQPPAETLLAHCGKCGLTFQPKELQVRSKPSPDRSSETALVLADQPRGLIIEESEVVTSYGWSDDPGIGLFTSIAIVFVLYILWFHGDLGFWRSATFTATMALVALGAWLRSRPSTRLEIDDRIIRGGGGTLPLSDVTGIELENGWVVAVSRYDKPRLALVRPRDRKIAEFLAQDIPRRLQLAERVSSGSASPPRGASDRRDR